MKRGRGTVVLLLFALLILALIPLISAGFFSDLWSQITGKAIQGVGVNITIAAINIIRVNSSIASLALSSGPFKSSIMINFTAYHGAGVAQINDSTVQVNLSIGVSGEENRTNLTCFRSTDVSTLYANYSCNVTMWWFDTNGTWNISVFLRDNNSNIATNLTQTFSVQLTTGFDMGPINLTWAIMAPGAINQTSNNDPLTLNNTGNKQIGIPGWGTNLSVNATHLVGETNKNWRIFAENFSVASSGSTGTCEGAGGNCFECDTTAGKATGMSFAAYTNITSANLTKGNFTINNNYTAQEQLFFCLKVIDTGLIAQSYSTAGNGTWVVQI